VSQEPSPIDRVRARLLAIALLVPASIPLLIATFLEPDPATHGTHVQLGLRPCSVLTWTGYPCPMCGMTTSFVAMMHLRPIDAAIAQPFGVLLFTLTFATAGISIVELIAPTERWKRLFAWMVRREGTLAGLFIGTMIVAWLYKIWQLS